MDQTWKGKSEKESCFYYLSYLIIILRQPFRFWFKTLFLLRIWSPISRQKSTSDSRLNTGLKKQRSGNKMVPWNLKNLFPSTVMSNNIAWRQISRVFLNLHELFRAKKCWEKNFEKLISWDIELLAEVVTFRKHCFYYHYKIEYEKNIKSCFCEIIYFYSQ